MAKDLEKENKKLKKKAKRSGTVALVLILLLLIIAAIFILFKPFGLGLGLLGGTGLGASQTAASAAPADTTAAVTEETGDTVTYLDVTIKDAAYILDGSEVSSYDIVSRAQSASGKVIVRLTNDNGIIDAYDKLTKALEQNNITFEKDSSFDVE
ncbi:MAG: hypothetical protein IJT87_04230 [Ruminiclostridium sp.]|nr:hypothetical protein [Ruminiclostridium sp.]